ncbi:hypothetical protein MASR1M66_07430 [Aminivibrio sp.]
MRRCLRHENKMNLFEKQSNEILRILLIIFLGTIITYIVFMTGPKSAGSCGEMNK